MKPNLPTAVILSSSLIELRYVRPLFNSMVHITDSRSAMKCLEQVIDKYKVDLKEHFYVLMLTNSNRLLGISIIAIGGASTVSVNIREIVQLALVSNCQGVIVAHNHPSGQLIPSISDVEITEKIKEALLCIDVSLLDHLVFTSEGYTSFADNGRL